MKRPAIRKLVYDLIDGEIEYAQHWDKMRPESSQKDADKPIEAWLLWMEEYLSRARKAATTSVDKTEALENIRKLAGLAVNCMTYHPTPARK